MKPFARVGMMVIGLLGAGFPVHAAGYELTIDAAAVDRVAQVVEFVLPADTPRPAHLVDDSGQPVAWQASGDGRVRFVVAQQAAGKNAHYQIVPGEFSPEGVTVAPANGDLRISVAGQPVLVYRLDAQARPREGIPAEVLRAGYVHPVYSPAGKIVTDDYPSNHVHHHGIFSAWCKTVFQGRQPDFWNMHLKKGAEDLVALDRTWSGPVHGGFFARLKMEDRLVTPAITALNETWELTAYAVGGTVRPLRVFDLVITQQCATGDRVVLPTYHYGGFAFRGAAGWNGPGAAAHFLTSEGITDREQGNNTRARWCYLGGAVDGSEAGTAVLGHPDNFRAPQPVRLHPDMPYFSFAPQQLGEFALEPGQTYTSRFRFVVADGAPDAAWLNACWNAYAIPAVARVTKRPATK